MSKNALIKTCILLVTISAMTLGCKKENPPKKDKTDNTSGSSNLKDTTILDLSYGNHQRNKLDLYLPEGRDEKTRVIFIIHGGAWKAGKKEDMNQIVNLIRNKWKHVAIANINYRLASNTDSIHHEAIMDDISQALEFIATQRQNYAVSDTMMIMGASAGGHLAMLYAYAHNTKGYVKCVGNVFGPSMINDWSWYNSVNIWLGGPVKDILIEYVGQSWDSAVYASVSPRSVVSSSSVPTIIFHGNLDPIVPVYQSQWLANKLKDMSVPYEYHEYIAFHSFDNTQLNDVTNKLINFFKTHAYK